MSLPTTIATAAAMEKLPPELAAKVTSRVAKAAADPMEDLGNLRALCSQMRRACGDAYVGRSIPLERVLRHCHKEPYYTHEYRANLITRLASVGHPEACFKAGMSAIFVEDRGIITPRLHMLERAAESGHEVATYVLSLVMYSSNSGAANDAKAQRLLQKVEGDEAGPAAKNATWKNTKAAWRRHQAVMALQDDLVVPHAARLAGLPPVTCHPVPRQDRHC